LRAVWAARRAERQRLERHAQGLETVRRAIAGVRRDRDAGTSAALRRDRALFEQLLGDVDDLACLLARTSIRLGALGLPADAPPVRSGLAAGEAGLAALAAVATALNAPAEAARSDTTIRGVPPTSGAGARSVETTRPHPARFHDARLGVSRGDSR
jgi:hypothetical protein